MSCYLHGIRQFSWLGGNGFSSQPMLQLQLRLTSHYLQNKDHGNCASGLSMGQTPRCIFSTLCVVRSDPYNGCSSCRLSDASVCSGTHMSCCRCNMNWCSKAWSARSLMTSPIQQMFWEREPKGGYGSKTKQSRTKLVREGLKELRTEISKWQQEVKEKFEDDPIWVMPGDMDKVWMLDSEAALEKWVVTSDSDHGEGFSSGSLTISPTGHGLFSGHISTQVPKDGRVKSAGYCNMKSLRPRKSFKRDSYLNWALYTHLELRVRGDGRNYLLNIGTAGYYDVTWNDVYSYILYTRGGPHWQLTRIPFSKFFLTSKGRVQDKQSPVQLDQVTSLGISAGDRINAPFHLEIDYIGVYLDPNHSETFAYEMYQVPKFMGD